jgi:hypothetical protein
MYPVLLRSFHQRRDLSLPGLLGHRHLFLLYYPSLDQRLYSYAYDYRSHHHQSSYCFPTHHRCTRRHRPIAVSSGVSVPAAIAIAMEPLFLSCVGWDSLFRPAENRPIHHWAQALG